MKHPNPWQDNQKLIKVNNTRWSINFRTYIWSLDKGLKSWEKVRGWRLNIITKFNNWEIKRKAINIDRLTWFLNWLARDCTHQDPSSVQPLCRVWLCDPMDCSMPGFPVYHQLLELAQTQVHWVGNAIQPLSSLSPPAFNLTQNQGLFQWIISSHQMAKVLEFQLQHQSFQWTPRTDLL